jgi:hypothetical protein
MVRRSRSSATVAMVDRIASAWSRQSIANARVELVDVVDQWTLQVRRV